MGESWSAFGSRDVLQIWTRAQLAHLHANFGTPPSGEDGNGAIARPALGVYRPTGGNATLGWGEGYYFVGHMLNGRMYGPLPDFLGGDNGSKR